MVVSPEFVVILRFEDTENYENFHRASEGNEKGGEPRGEVGSTEDGGTIPVK